MKFKYLLETLLIVIGFAFVFSVKAEASTCASLGGSCLDSAFSCVHEGYCNTLSPTTHCPGNYFCCSGVPYSDWICIDSISCSGGTGHNKYCAYACCSSLTCDGGVKSGNNGATYCDNGKCPNGCSSNDCNGGVCNSYCSEGNSCSPAGKSTCDGSHLCTCNNPGPEWVDNGVCSLGCSGGVCNSPPPTDTPVPTGAVCEGNVDVNNFCEGGSSYCANECDTLNGSWARVECSTNLHCYNLGTYCTDSWNFKGAPTPPGTKLDGGTEYYGINVGQVFCPPPGGSPVPTTPCHPLFCYDDPPHNSQYCDTFWPENTCSSKYGTCDNCGGVDCNVTCAGPTPTGVPPTSIPVAPNCANISGPTTLNTGESGVYSADVTTSGGALAGEINYFNGSINRILYQAFSPPSAVISTAWTPPGAGSYTVCCRAWNDGAAECRPALEGSPGPPVYTCAGPNSCMTVAVSSPATGTIQGRKVIMPGDQEINPAKSQIASLPGYGSANSSPYWFNNVSAGNQTVSVTVPLGYSVVSTSCINRIGCHTDACANGFPLCPVGDARGCDASCGGAAVSQAGTTRTVFVPAGGYNDLWWHYTPPNSPPSIVSLVIKNLAGTVVPAETASGDNRNHICQIDNSDNYYFLPNRKATFELTVSDPDGCADISTAQLKWNNDTYNLALNNCVGTVTVDYTGVNNAGLFMINGIVTDSKGATSGWQSTDRKWKVWDCNVATSGSMYDSSAQGTAICPNVGFTDLAADAMSFVSVVETVIGSPPPITIPANGDHHSYNAGNLTWGKTVLMVPTVNASGIKTRWIDKGTGSGIGSTGCGTQATLDNGIGGVVDPYTVNPSLQVDFSATADQNPWWQAAGGGVMAKTSIGDLIPATCIAPCQPAMSINSATGGNGLAAAGGITNSSGCVLGTCSHYGAPNDWGYQHNVIGENYGYKYFYNNYYGKTGAGKLFSGLTKMSQITAAGVGGTGVILVAGNVEIDTDNTLNTGNFLMIVASGSITIDQNVTQTEGILVAGNGVVAAGTNAVQLEINGVVYAAGGDVSLTRGYVTQTDNNTNPGVLVTYRPDLIFSLPSSLSKVLTSWSLGK